MFVASTLGDEFRRELNGWFKHWGSVDTSLTSTWQRVSPAAGDAAAAPTTGSAGGSSGSDGKSSMSLPSHVSPHVMSFLFALTQELYRVNGGSGATGSADDTGTGGGGSTGSGNGSGSGAVSGGVDPHLLNGLVQDVSSTLLGIHESELNGYIKSSTAAAGGGVAGENKTASSAAAGLCEAAAIQFGFDTQFLFAILRLPESARSGTGSGGGDGSAGTSELDGPTSLAGGNSSYRDRFRMLLSTVEHCVDPINWQEATQPLRSRLQRLTARCTVLFGTLLQSSLRGGGGGVTLALGSDAIPSPLTSGGKSTAGGGGAGTKADVESGETANIMPLAATSIRVAPFRTSLYPTKRFQQQNRLASTAGASTAASIASPRN